MSFIHPNEFNKLTNEEKQIHVMKIFIENEGQEYMGNHFDYSTYKYVDIPCYKVSRKFKEDRGNLQDYEMDTILLKYENNKLVLVKDSIEENYRKFYNIHNKLCIDCGEDSMFFDYGDKSYVYSCRSCPRNFEKEFFHRHGQQYLYDK